MNGIGHLPSVENLQCFVAASDHLNFRRAAAEMALTPTAFGQRIKQLEEQLGLELFARTTRHVALTPAGHRLLPAARDAIAAARRCTELVHHGESISARFTLGTRFELGMSWIVPALLELKRVRPNWHIDLYVGSGADIVDRLRARTLDTIVTSAPIARADWSAEFLHPEEYVFVAAPQLLARVPFDSVEDAPEHTILDIDDSLPLTRYLTSAGTDLDFGDAWFIGSGAPMIELLLRSHGVAVLPEYMIRDHLDAGRLVRLLPGVSLLQDSFRLLFRSDSAYADVLVEVADFLRGRPLS